MIKVKIHQSPISNSNAQGPIFKSQTWDLVIGSVGNWNWSLVIVGFLEILIFKYARC